MNGLTRTLLPVGCILAAAIWVGLPFVGSAVLNDWQFRASTLVMLATSWNMMANAGLISLGHSAFWGVGSYAAILAASRLGLPLLPALGVAILAGAVLGFVMAAVTGSLRGIFFAIATLALAEGLRAAAFMTSDLTGGAVGLFLPQAQRPTRLMLEGVAAAAAIAAVMAAWLLVRSRYHYAFRAMRSNESACQMLGVDPRRFRIGIVALSGAVASCAGGLNAWYGGFLDPDTAFTLTFTIQAQIATILGGIHFVAGPVVGSILIVGLADATRILLGDVPGASQLAYGIILVLAVLFMSGGLCGAVVKRLRTKPATARTHPAEALP